MWSSERDKVQGEGGTFIGWYRLLQYADMISERPVRCLLGNWEGSAPPEARVSVIDLAIVPVVFTYKRIRFRDEFP